MVHLHFWTARARTTRSWQSPRSKRKFSRSTRSSRRNWSRRPGMVSTSAKKSSSLTRTKWLNSGVRKKAFPSASESMKTRRATLRGSTRTCRSSCHSLRKRHRWARTSCASRCRRLVLSGTTWGASMITKLLFASACIMLSLTWRVTFEFSVEWGPWVGMRKTSAVYLS